MLAFRLRPRGGFHFGRHGTDIEQSSVRCPSDTLYAALFNEALRWGMRLFAPLTDDTDDPPPDLPFLISSAFPYAGEVLLLPRPQLRLPLSEQPMEPKQRKLIKRLEYVSPTILRLIIENQARSLDPYLKDQGSLLMDGQVWVAHCDGQLPLGDSKQPITKLWKEQQVPHVTVDRGQAASQYYQVGRVNFATDCGLYLLCEERQPGGGEMLLTLLRYLGDSGLGGRRSAGLGQFSVELIAPPALPQVTDPRRMILLSRYRPSQAEIAAGVFGEEASYGLVKVRGMLQSPLPTVAAQRRQNVRMLSEGSVIQFRTDGSAPLGTICDVRPRYTQTPGVPHPVWRYGLAMGLAIGGEPCSTTS
jgi:CRISPR-associated protein Csm4